MARVHKLTQDPLADHKVRRITRDLIKDDTEDRKMVKDAYAFFKKSVNAYEKHRKLDPKLPPSSGVNEKCMIDCLRLMQSAKNKTTKLIIDTLKKSIGKNSPDKKSEGSTFEALMKDLNKLEEDKE